MIERFEQRGLGEAGAATLHRCRPGRRCVVCQWLERDGRMERFLFAGALSQDETMVACLRRLASLFFDANESNEMTYGGVP